MDFIQKKLENGLTIVAEVNPRALSAAVGFFVKTGSRDESPAVSGVSHFLEHMMFKGTEKLTALQVNEAFDRLGAKFNAFTSEENTVYYAAVLPEYMEEVTDIWTQLMRPSLRDDDFDIEKNVIKEEIAMYKDIPMFDVMDRCRALHFKDHPCGNSVLGTEQSIDDLTSEQMREYFTRRYAPNNMVLACCGNIDFKKICDLIQTKCAGWQKDKAGRTCEFYNGSLEKKFSQKETLVRDHICLLSPAVSMQDKRRFAMSMLSMIIGDSTGSRYFWSLVDTAIAEIAGMQCESMDGVGVMYSYIRCSPDKRELVMQKLNDIFKEINEKGVTEEELQKAKNKVLSALTVKSEQPMGRLTSLGFNWVYLEQYQSVTDDINSIRSVTVKQVNELISEFKPGCFTQLSIGPGKTD
ncbi:MAG: insulinase family protein [Sedimentisphaerales bacterium]|nr:insulinase family protein [Sedimentisphaerales bacterium]